MTMLEQRGRVRFDRGASTWLRQAIADDKTVVVPVSDRIAIRAGELHARIPELADAIIYATALEHDAKLVTRDRILQEIDPGRIIWSGVPYTPSSRPGAPPGWLRRLPFAA